MAGTETYRNLLTSYIAESTAYSRYTFYAGQAEKEKYFQIANIFNETALNELRHAKVYFKYLPDSGVYTIPFSVQSGVIGNTSDNLAEAAYEEKTEGYEAYEKFAEVALKEGFEDIAAHFSAIAEIERHHHERFLAYKKQVDEGTVWSRPKPIKWQCIVCGYIYEGTEPPKVCPACDHPFQHTRALDMED